MTLEVGAQFAGYRIQRLVAKGGMGEVYAARHPVLDRLDAIKLLRAEFADDAVFRERFLREAHLSASVRHPAVVPVYNAGEASGRLYLVMQYVAGSDLRERLTTCTSLTPTETVSVVGAVAGALDAAHRRGLVHRDVKPGNILLADDADAEDGGGIYLSDFGITRLQKATTTLSEAGSLVGSMGYIAPEQISGKSLDGRADTYSLGCVAFECLTGQLPFGPAPQPVMINAHLHRPPPLASVHAPHLPVAVDEVLQRALAKDPEERFSSCRQFAAALAAALDSAAVPINPDTVPGAPQSVRTTIPSLVDLGVSGGPLAGVRVPLQAGSHVVGRGEQADVRLADPFLSRRHFVVHVSASGEVEVGDAGSSNGTMLEGVKLTSTRPLAAGMQVEAGSSVFAVLAHLPLEEPRAADSGRPDLFQRPIRSAVREEAGAGRMRRWLSAGRGASVAALRDGAPDALEIRERAVHARSALWERRPGHPDFLRFRLGWTTDDPDKPTASSSRVPNGRPARPVSVDLATAGPLGITGGPAAVHALGRWLVLQAATLSGPDDLMLVVAVPTNEPLAWSWVPLLPHTASPLLPRGAAWASDSEHSTALLTDIATLVDERHRTVAHGGPRIPQVLVVTSEGARSPLTTLRGLGPAVGVHVVLLGERAMDGSSALLDGEVGGVDVYARGALVTGGTPDGVDPEFAREVALALGRRRPG